MFWFYYVLVLCYKPSPPPPPKRSDLFVGAQLGLTLNHIATLKNTNKTYLDPNYGLRVGYEGYFGSYGGMRIYTNISYENIHLDFDDTQLNASMLHYALGADYLFEFLNPINPSGIFIGMGYEWNSSELSKKLIEDVKNQYITQNSHGIFMNVGISQIFLRSSKVELGFKVPFYTYIKMERISKMKNFKINIRSYGNFYVAYSYIF
ncbi:outer membrane beta-barrel protein [Helicobacter cappadocius]|uniref:Outer membrane beta-barrel protein n=1 Tax=Helicobacter cappadocius TaxID=3063998 RepID=A0ABT8Z330_9HELI|nr:outer membrane beta-barrel protein [Helicobacter sp. faydin-H75]MDO7252399.1 outer membrane beta-barrel protein [Helicobacter sp. faydin-H75]